MSCSVRLTPAHRARQVFPWLVRLLRDPACEHRPHVVVTLIYFARLERYKRAVVQVGGFDFLSELIRQVRSGDGIGQCAAAPLPRD